MIELSKKKKEKARRRGMVLGGIQEKLKPGMVLEVLTGGRRKEKKRKEKKSSENP